MNHLMPPLPFNLGINDLMLRGVTAALFVAPLSLTFAAFVPLILLDNCVKAALGLPPNASLDSHQYGAFLTWLFVLLMVALMAAGYLLGWTLNALCLVMIARWPWPKVLAVLLRSEIPSSWLRTTMFSERERVQMREEFEQWAVRRAAGARRFILKEGVLKMGGAFLILLTAGRVLKDDPVLIHKSWPDLLLGAALLGAIFATIFWFWREHRYLYRQQLLVDG